MLKHSFFAIIAGLACAACATTAPSSSPASDRILVSSDAGVIRDYSSIANPTAAVAAPADSAFAALRAIYKWAGVDVTLYKPETRDIGNLSFTKYNRLGGTLLHEYVSCGSTMTGPAADNYRVQMSLVSRVTPKETGSSVETVLTARADDPGTSKGWLACQTTGALENKINHQLAKAFAR